MRIIVYWGPYSGTPELPDHILNSNPLSPRPHEGTESLHCSWDSLHSACPPERPIVEMPAARIRGWKYGTRSQPKNLRPYITSI